MINKLVHTRASSYAATVHCINILNFSFWSCEQIGWEQKSKLTILEIILDTRVGLDMAYPNFESNPNWTQNREASRIPVSNCNKDSVLESCAHKEIFITERWFFKLKESFYVLVLKNVNDSFLD